MRVIEYRHVLKPSVDYLEQCGVLLLDAAKLGEFLGIPRKVVQQLASTDRIPMPMRLGFSQSMRWNIFELLDWVQAGCPRRMEWIRMIEKSGRYRAWRWPY